ncbi:ATP-binding protein [Thalassotalea maritima]|uniref:ATP-binding protein n=1 Tax=Thalassotalea maritima TaxID=3242416 RepID=UPI00352717F6
MRFQFFRLYLLIIIAVSVVVFSFDQFMDSIDESDEGYTMSVDYLFEAYSQRQNNKQQVTVPLPTFRYTPLASLALPDDLQTLLQQHRTIAVTNEQQQTYYYRLTNKPDQVVQLGPVIAKPRKGDAVLYLALLFYGCLAILLLLFMRPMFRDLRILQQDAQAFGRQPVAMQSDIRSSSSIYPLASAFHRMSSKIVDFIDMNKDLSRAISHEIRTPLARMKFMLALISDQIDEKKQKQIHNDIREIELLVNDYLSFSKVESQLSTEQVKQYSPQALLKVIKKKFAVYSDDIDITISAKGDKAWFHKDAIALAMQNLITNALRYADRRIDISFECDDEHCRLTVADDGPGLQAHNQASSVDNSNREKHSEHKSFGLGLYLVKKIAILHEGTFTITRSERLGGAEIQLCWPNRRI